MTLARRALLRPCIGEDTASSLSSPPRQFNVPRSLATPDSVLKTQPSVIVGRETELAQLHGWLERALGGERQLVFVSGEAGIGKTALMEAFRQRLEAGDWRLVPA